MSTIEELDQQIEAFKTSDEYTTLIIKHRGPLEDRRLAELNLRINALENQKKMLMASTPAGRARLVQAAPLKAKTHSAPKISREGVVKAKPNSAAPLGRIQGIKKPVAPKPEPIKPEVKRGWMPAGFKKAAAPLAPTPQRSVENVSSNFNSLRQEPLASEPVPIPVSIPANQIGRLRVNGVVKAGVKDKPLAPAMSKILALHAPPPPFTSIDHTQSIENDEPLDDIPEDLLDDELRDDNIEDLDYEYEDESI